jgi:hypothetical protein
MNQVEEKCIADLSRACGKTLQVGSISGWQHPHRGGALQVMSDTKIRVAIGANGTVADIDLGSFLQSSPPYGNDNPPNRFRVAVMALRFPGRTFGDICERAGGSKAQFDVGWMPPPVTGEMGGSHPETSVVTVADSVAAGPSSSPTSSKGEPTTVYVSASSKPAISSCRTPERTAHSPWNFVLQFPPSEIPALVKRRLTNVDEAKAAEAGRSIAAGDYSRANLRVIVAWKNEGRWLDRVLSLLDQNTDQEIEGALRVAATTADERTAIAVLCGLKGIGVPTASAVMTEIRPDKYTIIDVNALKSLGVPDDLKNDVDYYVAYLWKCRELASTFAVSLREIDHALWQWGHEH